MEDHSSRAASRYYHPQLKVRLNPRLQHYIFSNLENELIELFDQRFDSEGYMFCRDEALWHYSTVRTPRRYSELGDNLGPLSHTLRMRFDGVLGGKPIFLHSEQQT
jgi:hypothetical protein